MSSDLLAKLEDVRPGLLFSSKTARQNEMQKRKLEADCAMLNNKKKLKTSLKESLATPIDRSNIGFSMLAKMGFKEGSGLGKTGEGMKDPVAINLKLDRCGLGTETVAKEKKEKADKVIREVRVMRDKAMRMQRDQFRNEKQALFHEKRMASILRNNQKVCLQLDSAQVS